MEILQDVTGSQNGRLVAIMLQISIIILFQIFLKISLCSILFLLFYQYSQFTSKLLHTFSYNTAHKNFSHTPKLCYQIISF